MFRNSEEDIARMREKAKKIEEREAAAKASTSKPKIEVISESENTETEYVPTDKKQIYIFPSVTKAINMAYYIEKLLHYRIKDEYTHNILKLIGTLPDSSDEFTFKDVLETLSDYPDDRATVPESQSKIDDIKRKYKQKICKFVDDHADFIHKHFTRIESYSPMIEQLMERHFKLKKEEDEESDDSDGSDDSEKEYEKERKKLKDIEDRLYQMEDKLNFNNKLIDKFSQAEKPNLLTGKWPKPTTVETIDTTTTTHKDKVTNDVVETTHTTHTIQPSKVSEGTRMGPRPFPKVVYPKVSEGTQMSPRPSDKVIYPKISEGTQMSPRLSDKIVYPRFYPTLFTEVYLFDFNKYRYYKVIDEHHSVIPGLRICQHLFPGRQIIYNPAENDEKFLIETIEANNAIPVPIELYDQRFMEEKNKNQSKINLNHVSKIFPQPSSNRGCMQPNSFNFTDINMADVFGGSPRMAPPKVVRTITGTIIPGIYWTPLFPQDADGNIFVACRTVDDEKTAYLLGFCPLNIYNSHLALCHCGGSFSNVVIRNQQFYCSRSFKDHYIIDQSEGPTLQICSILWLHPETKQRFGKDLENQFKQAIQKERQFRNDILFTSSILNKWDINPISVPGVSIDGNPLGMIGNFTDPIKAITGNSKKSEISPIEVIQRLAWS